MVFPPYRHDLEFCPLVCCLLFLAYNKVIFIKVIPTRFL